MKISIKVDSHALKQYFLPVILFRILFILIQDGLHSPAVDAAIVDPNYSWEFLRDSYDLFISSVLREFIILAADLIGALCIHHICRAVIESEERSAEREMEKRLTVPPVLRPERGWVFGLPSKIMLDDNMKSEVVTKPKPAILSLQQLPFVISTIYLSNPISILAATHSLRSVWDMFLLISLYYTTLPILNDEASNQHPTGAKCGFFLALATYADVAYGVFIIPILLWRGLTKQQSERCPSNDWKAILILFVVYYGSLQVLATYIFEESTVKRIVPNVTFVELDDGGSYYGPNIGLHWYFFVQLFDRFRPYFSVFVSGIPAVFAIPLTVRLYRYPSVLIAAFQLLWSIFRPIATVQTLALGLIYILLNPRTIIRMRDASLIAFFALFVPISLFVTFHRMWLLTGNGNPNYLFFQCFAYGLFVAIILLDMVSATVKRDKVMRMVDKGITLGEAQPQIREELRTSMKLSGDVTQNDKQIDDSQDDISLKQAASAEPVVVFL